MADNGLGFGAAHGGDGGAPYPSVGGNGSTYNSLYRPTMPGSGGGNGNGVGGAGGSYIEIDAGEYFRMDGLISNQGQDGQSYNGGGGSGGGGLFKTLNYTGFGTFDFSGGAGSGTGGGGAGGRLAFWIRWTSSWNGYYWMYGGEGGSSTPGGAAGTAYTEESSRGPSYMDIRYDVDGIAYEVAQHKRLEIDNIDLDSHLYEDHGEPWIYTSIYEEGHDEYEFDEVLLHKHANAKIDYPPHTNNVTVKMHLFEGDRTGLVLLQSNQHLFVEVVESTSTETYAPCSFHIKQYAEIIGPTTTNLLGTRTVISGIITNVEHLIITENANVIFYGTAQTALIENQQYTYTTDPGNFTFSLFTVERGSVKFAQLIHTLRIEVAELKVKYLGKMIMNDADIIARLFVLESGGVFNADGTGHGSEEGPGAGQNVNGVGSGAGHGGFGGAIGSDGTTAGRPYNTFKNPLGYGSGGGSDGTYAGGAGGGFLDIVVGELIEIDGILGLKGKDCTGGNSGGGSGGSLLVKTFNASGHGVIAIHGGSGCNSGSGGSGGRAAIRCEFSYVFGGIYDNYGGKGSGSYEASRAGASGTTYKEESHRPVEYRIRKFDPNTNSSYQAADHTYLHTDNDYRYSDAFTAFNDDNNTFIELDEMEITGTSKGMSTINNVTMVVHKFIGDRTGTLHILSYQKVYVEVVESESNMTQAPVAYFIYEDAEIILPTEVHLHGVYTYLAGLVTGVNDLYIEDNAIVEFMSTAHTARKENGVYVELMPKGNFSWDTLHVKRGGEAGFLDISDNLHINVSEIQVKYEGGLFMNAGIISCTYAFIESEGVFHLNAKGYPAEEGVSPGITSSQGYGGCYGGQGGGYQADIGCDTWGSVFNPEGFGSGGGNGGGTGGAGGGYLIWHIGHEFELNGLLALQGGDGSGGDAGGGSGGSALVHTTNMTGHGEIDISGGDGVSHGGGGSGGRAAVHCRYKLVFMVSTYLVLSDLTSLCFFVHKTKLNMSLIQPSCYQEYANLM